MSQPDLSFEEMVTRFETCPNRFAFPKLVRDVLVEIVTGLPMDEGLVIISKALTQLQAAEDELTDEQSDYLKAMGAHAERGFGFLPAGLKRKFHHGHGVVLEGEDGSQYWFGGLLFSIGEYLDGSG